MTIEEIKEILQLLVDSGVAEIEVQRGENRVWIKRSHSPAQDLQFTLTAPALAAQPVPSPAVYPIGPSPNPPAPSSPAPAPAPATPTEPENVGVIKAPIVGTFYEAPSPGAPPFVKVGDTVQPGQVLCIIESMKLMNEIEAEVPGVILAKLAANGKPVEYGESLFKFSPL